VFAVVEKDQQNGHVIRVGNRVGSGTMTALSLGLSQVSRAIYTAFLKHENGTDWHRNARKARKSFRFSKD
jgi:hypothetical protein